jgi:hypothetical protein
LKKQDEILEQEKEIKKFLDEKKIEFFLLEKILNIVFLEKKEISTKAYQSVKNIKCLENICIDSHHM